MPLSIGEAMLGSVQDEENSLESLPKPTPGLSDIFRVEEFSIFGIEGFPQM
jgi:hypothetical protein